MGVANKHYIRVAYTHKDLLDRAEASAFLPSLLVFQYHLFVNHCSFI